HAPVDTMIGASLDALQFSDLSRLSPEQLVTPTEKFYVRTAASELLDPSTPWMINVSGLVQEPVHLTLDELHKSAKPMGMHLMECSGNTRATRFSLLSVDRKSTRLNSSHVAISYAVFCLKKKR